MDKGYIKKKDEFVYYTQIYTFQDMEMNNWSLFVWIV